MQFYKMRGMHRYEKDAPMNTYNYLYRYVICYIPPVFTSMYQHVSCLKLYFRILLHPDVSWSLREDGFCGKAWSGLLRTQGVCRVRW